MSRAFRFLTTSGRGRAISLLILAIAVAAPIALLDRGKEPPSADAAATAEGVASPTVAATPTGIAQASGSGRWNGYGAWREHTGADGTLGDEAAFQPSISANGRWVAFTSHSSNLVRNDTNRTGDVFVKDRATGKTTRVSVSSAGRQANAYSSAPGISANGRYIAFISWAFNLVANDTNRCTHYSGTVRERCPDVFVHDQLTHRTIRVSVSSTGAQSNGGSLTGVAISADGRFVAFGSAASNLVRGDTNGVQDVFVRDTRDGKTSRVSLSSRGEQGDRHSSYPAISGDGNTIAFLSLASNLAGGVSKACRIYGNKPNEPCPTAYVRRLDAANTVMVGRAIEGGRGPAISADGRVVAFTSDADDIVPGDTNGKLDVFVYELANARTTRVSVSSSEEQGNEESAGPALSADGRFVAFWSKASNLAPHDVEQCENLMDGIAYSCYDVFLRDRQVGTTELASLTTAGAQPDWSSSEPALSADARHVAFSSEAANMTSTPPGSCAEYNCSNVFARDRSTGVTRPMSTASPRANTRTDGDGGSRDPSVSADGSAVAFVTGGSNFVRDDMNGQVDIVVWRRSGGFSRVSISSNGREANGPSEAPALSDDGRVVAFLSEATNLVAGDTNGHVDVFVRDMASHRTTRASVSTSGAQANGPSGALTNGAPVAPAISADGRYVVFASDASNLVPGDTNGAPDVFLYDRSTGRTTRVSLSSGGDQGNATSVNGSISANGRWVAFASEASNLVEGDPGDCPNREPAGSCWDIFVHDLVSGTTSAVSVTDDGQFANGDSHSPAISGDGESVAFISFSNNLAGGRDPDDFSNPVYVRDLVARKTIFAGHATEQSSLNEISHDGRYVGPVIGEYRFSIFDRSTGRFITVTNCGSTYKGELASGGRYLVWGWDCEQDGDRNGYMDVYMFDRVTGSITWISKPVR